MTHLETALLQALGVGPGTDAGIVTGMVLVFRPNQPPLAEITLLPDPAALDAATEPVIKRFELVEFIDTEVAA